MTLTAHLGDTKTFSIPLRWGNRPFLPGGEWHLVFTAKFSPQDSDPAAPIQLQTGSGITITGSRATIRLTRALTLPLEPDILRWDIQAEKLSSDEVRTVRSGRLALLREITRTRKSPATTGNHLRDEDGEMILDDQLQPIIYT
jgi:hypothetical protein